MLPSVVRSWVVGGKRKVAYTIMFFINAMGLQLECVRMLHESLFRLVLLYGQGNNDMERKGKV